MRVTSEPFAYGADGLAMVGELSLSGDDAGPRPGVLVFPDAFGLAGHARLRARRLAELGYAAFACDLHGDGRSIAKSVDIKPTVMSILAVPGAALRRAQGALTALAGCSAVNPSQIAATGYCLGGSLALDLARSGAAIAATIGLHCGLLPLQQGGQSHVVGKVLVCLGADDPSVPAEQRALFEAEMRAANIDWRMHLYGGVVHSFTDTDAPIMNRPELARYDPGADARSWREMTGLLAEVFG